MNQQIERTTPEQDPIQNAIVVMTLIQENKKLFASCDIHPIATQPHAFIAPMALALLINGMYSRVLEAIPEEVRKEYIEEYQIHLNHIRNNSNQIKRTHANKNTPKLELIPTDTTIPPTSGNGCEYSAPKLEIF